MRFKANDLIWYRMAWSVDHQRVAGVWLRGTPSGYWTFVRLLLPDGSSQVRRVRSTSLTRRSPDEAYS